MISGGNATVYVSNMDKAVQFYTEVLGLKLVQRFGNEWAEVNAKDGFVIGLHPRRENDSHHRPGTPGSVQIGLNVDEKLENVISTLQKRGVEFRGGIIGNDSDSPVSLAFLGDPDGNEIYLCETKE